MKRWEYQIAFWNSEIMSKEEFDLQVIADEWENAGWELMDIIPPVDFGQGKNTVKFIRLFLRREVS
ncbi:MAG TPA: hypothetical protein VNM45_05680 [Bacillus sp. (in: firmicutes)]|nr:hypothetical protein [Bacillus sp. (in: firmicutes)]